jgi:hypothetical protein
VVVAMASFCSGILESKSSSSTCYRLVVERS